MSTQLYRIANKAKQNPKFQFTSLAHLLTPNFLLETWKQMNRKGCSGIDGMTMKEFSENLEERIEALHQRLKAGKYQAPPVKRVEIPKSDGKTRPLGIPTVEDRLLQRAVGRILSAIYEQDFAHCSYGFREGRGPHDALVALRTHITKGKVRFVYEADIRAFFNKVNHQWLQKMISHRIADSVILKLIGKWLKAGAMQNGVVRVAEEGTPQGGPVSPILANVYLHYVLDLWFQAKCKPRFTGEAHLVRFVDDFVICFQNLRDAKAFERSLQERMNKFGLETVPEKTHLLRFGRFSHESGWFGGIRKGVFNFLGFKHVSGIDTKGKFALVRIPAQKSLRKFIDRTYAWLRQNIHRRRRDQQGKLAMMLTGFYQYFSIHHCHKKLCWIKREVEQQWIRVLKNQSQRHRIYWSYLQKAKWFQLPFPPIQPLHPEV